MNGHILSREVADDISKLEKAVAPDACDIYDIVKTAVIRALRMSEDSGNVARRNQLLLIVILIWLAKNDALTLITRFLK